MTNPPPPSDANNNNNPTQAFHLTPQEMVLLQRVLRQAQQQPDSSNQTAAGLWKNPSTDESSIESDYTEFAETTHAWAVFADNPAKRATKLDRGVGTLIIVFQLFTYYIFAAEAIEDYQRGQVYVMTTHANCLNSNEAPNEDFSCEAEYTNQWDAFVAFFMLSIFLTPDILQAARAIKDAPGRSTRLFACLAGIEVVCAFVAASISISYFLYIGEVTDAVEVGVGLLFIRELSTRAYHGIKTRKKTKRYKSFFGVLFTLILLGLLLDPLYEYLFAAS